MSDESGIRNSSEDADSRPTRMAFNLSILARMTADTRRYYIMQISSNIIFFKVSAMAQWCLLIPNH